MKNADISRKFLEKNIDRFISIRHKLHMSPELAFEEKQTSAFISNYLNDIGLKVSTGIGGTGLVATLSGGNAPTIGLRADMDALPIREKNNFSHASHVDGKMHACGHDGHITILLALAELLVREKSRPGDVHFYFQPAEEIGSGAQSMLEDNVLKRFPCDKMIGFHNWPQLPLGVISVRHGVQMSAFQSLEVDLLCGGGHAAMPENCPDIFSAMSDFLNHTSSSLKELTSENAPVSFSFTRVRGGTAINLIPTKISLEASFRYSSSDQFSIAAEIVNKIQSKISLSHSVNIESRWIERFSPLTNDEAVTSRLINSLSGVSNLIYKETKIPSMVSDDFGYFAEQIPSCYFWIGSGQKDTNLHADNFDFNDEILKIAPVVLHNFVMSSGS